MKEKLLKVQQEIAAIKKDSVNPHFKNRYFDINTLLAEVKPVLNKHGIVLLQGLSHGINGELMMETRLISTEDKDGDIAYLCPIPPCADAQKYGSAATPSSPSLPSKQRTTMRTRQRQSLYQRGHLWQMVQTISASN